MITKNYIEIKMHKCSKACGMCGNNRKKEDFIMWTINKENNALTYQWDGEILKIEPWGANSFRVRSTILGNLEDTDYAILPQEKQTTEIQIEEYIGTIINGKIKAVMNVSDWNTKCTISFFNQRGELVLKEAGDGGSLNKKSRQFKPILGEIIA